MRDAAFCWIAGKRSTRDTRCAKMPLDWAAAQAHVCRARLASAALSMSSEHTARRAEEATSGPAVSPEPCLGSADRLGKPHLSARSDPMEWALTAGAGRRWRRLFGPGQVSSSAFIETSALTHDANPPMFQ